MSVARQAPLEETPAGLAPDGPGWFVVNAEDAPWLHAPPFGRAVGFEGRGAARFGAMGFNLRVLEPGEAAAMYHAEDNQEAVLVVSGEATLLVDGGERALRRWDFVHLPPGTPHTVVGAGDGPCVLVMAGVRGGGGLTFPADPVAQAHGAGVAADTDSAGEAYAGARPRFAPGTVPE